jgi:acyl-CoA synthetase (AMP-forming)/AMP-acid ligase II
MDMLYSSGTTGRPKGIQLPLPDVPLGGVGGVGPVLQLLFSADENAIYLSPAPLYHAAPLRFCMAMQRLGGTVIVLQHFEPKAALAAIEKYGATHSQWVPTMFVRMLKLPEDERAQYDVSSMRVAIHAAAPCPRAIKEQMFDWWGPVIHEYYAGTEGNGFVYCSPTDWLAHPGTVGKPLLGVVHVCDDDGNELSAGEIGTIYFQSESAFNYHKDEAQTAKSRHPSGNGWTTLGDIGYVDDEGFVFLTDRRGFTIVSGGVNIYPAEIENVLVLHPSVTDVAVFGVPNPDFGEEVKAVVQPAPGVEGSTELEGELLAFAREHLSHIKCPRSIDFQAELPRTPTGKLVKGPLRDRYWVGQKRIAT